MTVFYYFYVNRNNTNIRVICMHLCARWKKGRCETFGYKPLEKRFASYTYTFYIFLSPDYCTTAANLFIFLPHCVYIYISVWVYIHTCVCGRFLFFNLSFTGNWIGFCVCACETTPPNNKKKHHFLDLIKHKYIKLSRMTI